MEDVAIQDASMESGLVRGRDYTKTVVALEENACVGQETTLDRWHAVIVLS